jgi:hypothetical protein
MNNKFRPPDSYLPDTQETLVLVDYSNLLYRAWFVSGKRQWVGYSKFFDMLRLCVKRSKQKGVPLKVIFAGESKTPLHRKKLAHNYKGTRTNVEDPQFKKFRQELPELIRFLGWDILSVDGAEADDIIASIVADKCHRCKCEVPCDDCRFKSDVEDSMFDAKENHTLEDDNRKIKTEGLSLKLILKIVKELFDKQ